MSILPRNDVRFRSLVSRLKVRHLALLRALGDVHVLSRVADRLGVTQPAITKSLREIEDIFMTPLFDRVGRGGLRPTPAGTAVLEYARLALADLDATSRTLTAIDAGQMGRLRIGLLADAPAALTTGTLALFRSQPDRVGLYIREGDTTELLQAIASRELDCVLARAHHRHLEGVEQFTILRQAPCLMVGAKNKGRVSKLKLSLTRLSEMDWIMQPPGSTGRLTVDGIFVAAGISPPTPFLETHSLKAIEAALRDEPNAVCILARDVCLELVARDASCIVPMPLDWNLPPLTLFVTAESARYRLVRELKEALIQMATRLIS